MVSKLYKVITPEDAIKEIKGLPKQSDIFRLLSNPKFGGNPDIDYNVGAYIFQHYNCNNLAGYINLDNNYPRYFCGDGKLVDLDEHKPVLLAEAKRMVINALIDL